MIKSVEYIINVGIKGRGGGGGEWAYTWVKSLRRDVSQY